MAFKMRSPLLKDKKVWKWSGEQVTVDDSTLSPVIGEDGTEKKFDDVGNQHIQYNYTDEDGKSASEIMYLEKPRKEGPAFEEDEGPKMPSDRPIDLEFPRG